MCPPPRPASRADLARAAPVCAAGGGRVACPGTRLAAAGAPRRSGCAQRVPAHAASCCDAARTTVRRACSTCTAGHCTCVGVVRPFLTALTCVCTRAVAQQTAAGAALARPQGSAGKWGCDARTHARCCNRGRHGAVAATRTAGSVLGERRDAGAVCSGTCLCRALHGDAVLADAAALRLPCVPCAPLKPPCCASLRPARASSETPRWRQQP